MFKFKAFFLIFCAVSFIFVLIKYSDSNEELWNSHEEKERWTQKDISVSLKNWLKKIKSGRHKNNIQVRFFDKENEHFGPNYDEALEHDDEEERYKGGVTIGHFVGNDPTPRSLMWQWVGGEMFHGFLYGKVDSLGLFTGQILTSSSL